MNRRRFLAVGAATLVGHAGCLGSSDGASSDRPWPRSERVEEPDGDHHLFVENHTGTTEPAWVRVVREDGATLVDGRYELPDGRAIRFDDVAAWETTHTVEVALDGAEPATFEWHPEECGPDSEATGDAGSRNAAVRLEALDEGEPSFDFRTDDCDAISTGTLPAGPAEGFRLDE